MATLVNRTVWTTALGALRQGRVVRQEFNPDYCVIQILDGTTITAPPHAIHVNRPDAIAACQQQVEYWQDVLEKLQEET